MLRPIFKIILKLILGFFSFIFLYFIFAFVLSVIAIDKELDNEQTISIYLKTNGVHSDLVLPIKSPFYDWSEKVKFEHTLSKDTTYKYVAFGWGDKGFYLETPEWKDLKFSTAIKAAFGLGNTAIHATFFKNLILNESCKEIRISKNQYERLITYIDNSFAKDAENNFQKISTHAVYGNHDAFYEANGSYSFFKTCNTWTNSGLKISGQKCCLWTPFDWGIFFHYK
jgi:uncharacterized protein (TIGR02117 family)